MDGVAGLQAAHLHVAGGVVRQGELEIGVERDGDVQAQGHGAKAAGWRRAIVDEGNKKMTEDTTRTAAPAAEAMLAEAVAAHLAVDVALANDRRQALAACLEAPIVETQLLIALAAAVLVVPRLEAVQARQVAALALRPIDERGAIAPGLEAALSEAANELATVLAGRSLADLAVAGLREALDQAARVSQRFGERAAA
jgi:hypothetical protein